MTTFGILEQENNIFIYKTVFLLSADVKPSLNKK